MNKYIILASATLYCLITQASAELKPLNVLFLGDNGHHRPAERFAQLQPVLDSREIKLKYTDQMGDLNPENLASYDVLVLYANIDRIETAEEKSLLEFVEQGKGFVPLHCATFCFRNSKDVVALMGGQFKRHGTGVFHTDISKSNHPIMKGFGGFTSWDETYVHHLHNEKNRTVLSYRVDSEGREPWTWIRTHGKGRVFYTAWGHDHRTWSNPGFHNLVERGIRWAAGQDPSLVPSYLQDTAFTAPKMTPKRNDVVPFKFTDVGAKIPNYRPNARWGTQDEPHSKMQLPLPAEESIKHYITPVGFKIELFASDPDLVGKPIAMNWDERGRLWVCETYDYPNELQPEGKGRDRIRICEDTDGDGTADKFTVFAEKLSIPTAIAFYRGGAIVQNGVETLYLKDTDGDDRADVRKKLITGWGLGDTHGGVSNFRYGHDNWFWAMQGYNFSEPEFNGKKSLGFRMGFFRFRLDNHDPPSVIDLEFIRSTNNNTWGLGLSEEGIVFGSTANHNPSTYMPIPNRYYERVLGWSPKQLGTIADTHLFNPITENVRQVDQHGGYTAGAGHALYTARTYPETWWNQTAFVCGPTGHLVGTFVLHPSGADFHSNSPSNLIASDDEWAAPIAAEVGPDGNVWVLDWYNFIVQHNPTPKGFKNGKGNAYVTELRDKKHGRIYRVAYENAEPKATAWKSLHLADAETLVSTLKHTNMFWRLRAQRLLVERANRDVVPKLVDLLKDQSTDEIELNAGAVHALQTLKGLDALVSDSQALQAVYDALRHPSPGVRRNALQVLPSSNKSLEAILKSGVVTDSHPQVRLAAFLAMADQPSKQQAGTPLSSLIEKGNVLKDRWLIDAATSAAAKHAGSFLPHVAARKSNESNMSSIVKIVSEHFARSKPSAEEIEKILTSMRHGQAEVAEAIFTGLSNGWPKNYEFQLTPNSEALIEPILARLSTAGKSQFVKIAMAWNSRSIERQAQKITEALLAEVKNVKLSDEHRIRAAQDLIGLRPIDDEVSANLLRQITPQISPSLATGLIDSLRESRANGAGPQLVSASQSLSPNLKARAIGILLSRPQTTTSLLDALESNQLSLNDLKLDQKQTLTSHPNEKIRERAKEIFAAVGDLPNPDRQKVFNELLPVVQQKGDLKNGKAVYKEHCAKCHKMRGEGEQIGPDLTGMAVHPKSELLMHILDPSRSVESNYRIYSVVTSDGLVFNGMLAGESKTSIEIVDTQAKRHAIQRSDIEQFLSSKKSVMPDGFEKQIKPNELTDLLEYLTDTGPFVPLRLDRVATAVSTQNLFFDREGGFERYALDKWGPRTFRNVPFLITDPSGQSHPNIILLHGTQGSKPPKMPKSVLLDCNSSLRAVHLLSGVSGWGYPAHSEKSVSVTVRIHFSDGSREDHRLINGEHFSDYIRRVDVPKSQFAFSVEGKQIRYVAINVEKKEKAKAIEFLKGEDPTAPIIFAVTIEK